MKWIKYKIEQSVIDEQPILIEKKVGYSEANLAIAETEAYNGEYTIEEDAVVLEEKPLEVELGGTGSKSLEELKTKLGKDFDRAAGENIHLTDAVDNKVLEFSLYGKAVQNGTPTPEAPIDIEVAGSSGSIVVMTENEDSTQHTTATIQTPNGFAGIKVSEGGNYTDKNGQQWICDEIIKYADGSGKRIQRIGIIESYNGETITGVYMSTTGELTTGAKVLYKLTDEVITDLTAEEIAEIEKLHTFYPVTDISNDADCGMYVMYVCGKNGVMISEVIDKLNERIKVLSDTQSKEFILVTEQVLTFVDKVCTINDERITASSLADIYFTSDTYTHAGDCSITVDTADGSLTLTAAKQPTSEIKATIRVKVV